MAALCLAGVPRCVTVDMPSLVKPVRWSTVICVGIYLHLPSMMSVDAAYDVLLLVVNQEFQDSHVEKDRTGI